MKFKDRAMGRGDRAAQDRDQRSSATNETFIDQGCELIGELRFAEDVRIEGRVEGQILAAKAVVIGENAEIRADIEAESLEVFGIVEGDVHVARATTLHECAKVTGEIQTVGIVVEEGAQFKGCIVIGSDSPVKGAGSTVEEAPKEAGATGAQPKAPAETSLDERPKSAQKVVAKTAAKKTSREKVAA